jgi:hypothetical protein
MKVPRDKNGLSIQDGDHVTVQVGDGPAEQARAGRIYPPNPALEGCVLVEFPNGTAQWMPGHYLTVNGRP